MELTYLEEFDFGDEPCTLVVGFHGIGLVGYIACEHMAKVTKAKRVAAITSALMPPVVSIDPDGMVVTPFELCMAKEQRLAFLLVRIQPADSELREFTKLVVNFAKDHGMLLVMLGGIDRELVKEQKPHAFTTASEILPRLASFAKIPDGIFISGGIALSMIEAKARALPCVTIFAPSERDHVDISAAIGAIKALNQLLGTAIDPTGLAHEQEAYLEEGRKIAKELAKRTPDQPAMFT